MIDGYGNISFWGYSPCINLLESEPENKLQKLKLEDNSNENDPVNILLIGSADLRHVFKTVTCSNKQLNRKLHFYILESRLEIYARHLLLLAIALQSPKLLGLQDKVELYLELYGNTLIRKQSVTYLQKICNEFIRMITDFDYLKEKLPIVDISRLKFKERDYLEGILKFWRNPDKNLFDISMCWETRLRSYLQTRYDTKMNAFDWDYHMRLVEKEADVIDKHEYKKWRNIGVAFENRDGDYVLPNTTLASGIILMKNGERINLRGYWGDILVGPYIAMGIESDFKELFKKFNGYYRKTARNVTEHNLTSMFHTIMTGETYIPPKETDTTDNKVTEVTEELDPNDAEVSNVTQTNENVGYESIPVDSFKVTFLPFDAIKSMPLKEQYKHLFDIIYFSNSSIHNLIPEITPIFSNQTKIIIETAKFMLDLRKEKLQDFIDKATEKIHSVGCKVSYPVDAQKDAFIKFSFERENC
ncbi:dynein axonemal assembly factor 3 [Octopus bimaculoides]|uniref:Dynein assembly factor 3, axonemal n=1 Tax=Octopus bimaculoides TaxID=37653 RepID=A0A0L8G1J8_OCTBM|nr:dynein axonemal assembly factor 3 [Octopus bimaculoides]|eukprot:XP_014784911.1 PREDICTED: dynein assembly factor 3, axonemal-like [Octopus bimaculoides]